MPVFPRGIIEFWAAGKGGGSQKGREKLPSLPGFRRQNSARGRRICNKQDWSPALKTLEPAGDARGKSQTQNILRVQLLGRRRQRPVRPIKSLERPYLGNGKPEVD